MQLVLATLAELAGLTVVYGQIPNTPVTLRSPEPVPRDQARVLLEMVAATNGLKVSEESGVLRITAAAPEAAPQGRGYAPTGSDGARLYVHRLKHAEADALAQTLRSAFGLGEGSSSGGTVRMRSLTEQLTPPPPVPPTFDLSRGYSPGANGQTGPSGYGGMLRGPTQIVPDTRTNALLIRASPADYETIRHAVQELDIRPLQVLIEVVIAEVTRDRRLDVGLKVGVPNHVEPKTGIQIGGSGMFGDSLGSILVRLGGVGKIRADIALGLLAGTGRANVLSRPLVLAQNNEEARILVGSQQPFVQVSRTLPTDAAYRDQVVQYRDVGTKLTIRPTINPDGYVTLKVLQEVSSASEKVAFGAPVIDTREAETQLLVKDGHTAVIGGLIDEVRSDAGTGIPILQDLPLIGALFRSRKSQHTTRELFLFLTPRVLRTDEDVRELTEDVRESSGAARRALGTGVPPAPEPLQKDREMP